MRTLIRNAALGAAITCGMTLAPATFTPASADDLSMCVSAKEATSFALRHLQSRLMVAGLACNQRDAYNAFVESFRPPLADAGADLIAYFQRSGGGQAALNRHVTELANVAGLNRAEDPEAFCLATWNTFFHLQQDPQVLDAQAALHVMRAAGLPVPCVVPDPTPVPPVITAESQVIEETHTVVKASISTDAVAVPAN